MSETKPKERERRESGGERKEEESGGRKKWERGKREIEREKEKFTTHIPVHGMWLQP